MSRRPSLLDNMRNQVELGLTSIYFRAQKLRKIGYGNRHSHEEANYLLQMTIRILPALQDNYMFLIINNKTKHAAAVDPVDAKYVYKVAKEHGVKLTHILCTHHHWDHAGGNKKLVKLWPTHVEVWGADERIKGLSHYADHNESFFIGDIKGTCIHTPCHTKGHVCYYLQSPNKESVVFTGDTLFKAGAGAFFEGDAEQMFTSLQRLNKLPSRTFVFPGHEYSLSNLAFARSIDVHNWSVKEELNWTKNRRKTKDPTIPSTIYNEREWNPFMRVHKLGLQHYYGVNNPIAAMKALRHHRDTGIRTIGTTCI